MQLELLAPARNKDIGIAAIDCGADAVYIAGPAFGAREAAANSFEDIKELCDYAHRFGVRIYMVLNTILYDNELDQAKTYIHSAYEAGCDAVIIQDLGILKMELPPIELYASTQTNIRSLKQAQFLEGLGFTKLILARELSLEQIKEIADGVNCEIETFIHGALCVSYSGQCYLSEYLCNRSANRGACIQACRSNYDLIDNDGKILLKDEPILSLKDMNLSSHLEDLINAGVSSFKIEGRLKGEDYVKNTTLHYRRLLDEIISCRSDLSRRSYGNITKGFKPKIEATFNRGYTDYFIASDSKKLHSPYSGKSLGEYIGRVSKIHKNDREQCIYSINFNKPDIELANGDGLCIICDTELIGCRIDVLKDKNTVLSKPIPRLSNSSKVYRNSNIAFSRELNNQPIRLIPALLDIRIDANAIHIEAHGANGARSEFHSNESFSAAQNIELALGNFKRQLSKSALEYEFSVREFNVSEQDNFVPFVPLSTLNNIRRDLAQGLRNNSIAGLNDSKAGSKLYDPKLGSDIALALPGQVNKLNCSNALSRKLYADIGLNPEPAFELEQTENMELMRTKYCILKELDSCLVKSKNKSSFSQPLFLANNNKRFLLSFDCKNCEMVVREA